MLSKLSGHLDCVKCCSFAYESSLLGSGSWDGEVRVWRLDSSSDEGLLCNNIVVLFVLLSLGHALLDSYDLFIDFGAHNFALVGYPIFFWFQL